MTGGELIAEARKRGRLTQAELARRLGTHQPVVARWETGRTKPDFVTVQKAIRAAGFELTVGLTPLDDHDVTLIRRELRLLPHERLTAMVSAVNALDRMEAATRG
jgi:transcriptional regulator with XRE-family HTH domain